MALALKADHFRDVSVLLPTTDVDQHRHHVGEVPNPKKEPDTAALKKDDASVRRQGGH